jgi:large subunit ribosomal protein L29
MQAVEIRAMSDEELSGALDSAQHEMFNLRFQQATGRLKDTSRLAQVRRDIARLQTVQRERAIWAAYEAALAAGE